MKKHTVSNRSILKSQLLISATALLLFLVFLAAVKTGSSQVIYRVQAIDLGTLPGGTNSTAADINSAGVIVGTSETISGERHAFILSGTVMTDIGTLPGGDLSIARGINDLVQVVGNSRTINPFGLSVSHGFIWESGMIHDLGAYPPEDDIGSESVATAINNFGFISGHLDLAGVVWDLFGVPNFPPFPPYVRVTDPGPFNPARVFDINEGGQAVGHNYSFSQGFRWQAGMLELLATFGGGPDDYAYGINNHGVVVGRAFFRPPSNYHAVMWPDPVTIVDLGTLGGERSEAFAINDERTVVGASETTTGETVAFVWREGHGMQSLGTLGGSNSKAFAVNAEGQIVGESETSTGEIHATLWSITVVTEVIIDIKPKSDPNSINLCSNGSVPIAIMGSTSFDVNNVNTDTLRFAEAAVKVVGKKDPHSLCSYEDINGDLIDDLVCHFLTADIAGMDGESTSATVTGELFDETPFEGSDNVNIVNETCN